MIALGAPDELIEEKQEQLDDQEDLVLEVLPELYPAVQLYQACYGQFDRLENGEEYVITGFNRLAVQMEIDLGRLDVTPETWEYFKFLEHETVRINR
ncbi:MAG: hypothetical protein DHS20C12_11980 [Pseudohongiella sp.]|nr:MAG: hypothetical protein DHS20C12_11980 [Pseudohongiella sp.]